MGLKKRTLTPGWKAAPSMSEATIHRSVVAWMKAVRTDDWSFFHPANGGYRTKPEASAFTAMGVIPGIPDLVIVFDGTAYFIELKREGGKVTPVQGDCHERLKRAGARVAVCRSLQDVRETFRTWRIPTREAA